MRRSLLAATSLAVVLAAAPSHADDVSDPITGAQRVYEAGQDRAAQAALREALQLITRRAAAAALAAALPDALPGWNVDEETHQSAGAGAFSGVASRRFRNAQGQVIEIHLTSDTAVTAQLTEVLGNPMAAGSLGQLIRIGGHRAIQWTGGNVSVLVENRIVVQVQSAEPAEPNLSAAKLAYARATDMTRLTRR